MVFTVALMRLFVTGISDELNLEWSTWACRTLYLKQSWRCYETKFVIVRPIRIDVHVLSLFLYFGRSLIDDDIINLSHINDQTPLPLG